MFLCGVHLGSSGPPAALFTPAKFLSVGVFGACFSVLWQNAFPVRFLGALFLFVIGGLVAWVVGWKAQCSLVDRRHV